MGNFILTGIIAWFLPGVGHIYLGRLRRGLIIGAVVWIMLIVGIIGGGAYYPGYSFKDGLLLYVLNIFARLGNGLGCLVSLFLTFNQPATNAASWATFEYAGRFLEVAGLINYLAVIDAVDISLGRKK
jgi:TM2 domain-containing membrane protein YozV